MFVSLVHKTMIKISLGCHTLLHVMSCHVLPFFLEKIHVGDAPCKMPPKQEFFSYLHHYRGPYSANQQLEI